MSPETRQFLGRVGDALLAAGAASLVISLTGNQFIAGLVMGMIAVDRWS
ncbi:MAG: hypothetical protein JWQ03_3088 [Variovorax sp.]|nr:hypothetical protein [Variovorax sp.]